MQIDRRRRVRAVLSVPAWGAVVGACAVLGFGGLWRAPVGVEPGAGTLLAFAGLIGQTFSFHAGIALACVAAYGAVLRMKWVVLACVPLLAWTLGPAGWAWVRALPEPTPGAARLTVFSANVLYRNAEAAALVAQIDAADPDIVVLQEFHPVSHAGLGEALSARFPHWRAWPQTDAFGQAVFSRLPFEGEPALWWGGDRFRVPQLEFEVEWEGRRVTVWNVHTLPPSRGEYIAEQRAMVGALGERAARLMEAEGAPDALILVGDFNAPYGTNHLRELRGAGLSEAHDVAGRGRGGTWPERVSKLRYGPKIRLDHVMYRGGVRCVGAWVGEDFGSDHRPVVAVFEGE